MMRCVAPWARSTPPVLLLLPPPAHPHHPRHLHPRRRAPGPAGQAALPQGSGPTAPSGGPGEQGARLRRGEAARALGGALGGACSASATPPVPPTNARLCPRPPFVRCSNWPWPMARAWCGATTTTARWARLATGWRGATSPRWAGLARWCTRTHTCTPSTPPHTPPPHPRATLHLPRLQLHAAQEAGLGGGPARGQGLFPARPPVHVGGERACRGCMAGGRAALGRSRRPLNASPPPCCPSPHLPAAPLPTSLLPLPPPPCCPSPHLPAAPPPTSLLPLPLPPLPAAARVPRACGACWHGAWRGGRAPIHVGSHQDARPGAASGCGSHVRGWWHRSGSQRACFANVSLGCR